MENKYILLGMIILLLSLNIHAENYTSTNKIVEEEINGVNYTFPTESWFCAGYTKEFIDKCGKVEYDAYKDREINKSVEYKLIQDKLNSALSEANPSKDITFNLWEWIVTSIKELLGITNKHENNFQEICIKNPEYSWCNN